MPECRRELTEGGATDGSVVLGEMAHIVGEKEGATRGTSCLSLEPRNSYANLILLCPTCHTRIDKKENETQFPVEVLHQIKVEHEEWVRESLGGNVDPADLVYARIIDEIALAMDFEAWGWWTDHAVRDLLPFKLAEASEHLVVRAKATLWPGKYPALDQTAKAVVASFIRYVKHFESFSEMRSPGLLGEDGHYKRLGYNQNYHRHAAKAELWRETNIFLLADLVNCAERFAVAVREHINPSFHLVSGRFLIHDSMHMRGQGPAFALEQGEIDEGLATLQVRRTELKAEYPSIFPSSESV